MRYIKTLLLACLFFVLLIFFFQNQAVLSQKLQLTLNLFFLSAMTSMELPFYFLIITAFFLGIVLSLSLLVWDKINLSAKLMKNNWYIKALEHEVEKLQKQIVTEETPGFFEKMRSLSTKFKSAPVNKEETTNAADETTTKEKNSSN